MSQPALKLRLVLIATVVETVIVVEDSVRGRIPMTYRDPWVNRAEVNVQEVVMEVVIRFVAVTRRHKGAFHVPVETAILSSP